jgi:hypothetical protein
MLAVRAEVGRATSAAQLENPPKKMKSTIVPQSRFDLRTDLPLFQEFRLFGFVAFRLV